LYNDTKRILSKTKGVTQLPLGSHSNLGTLLEIYRISDMERRLKEWDNWTLNKTGFEEKYAPLFFWKKMSDRLFV